MRTSPVISALVAASLLVGGPSFGQGDGDPQQQRKAQRQLERAQQRQGVRAGPPQRQHQRDLQQRQRNLPPQYPHDEQQGRRDERGAGPDHDFHRGDRLPPQWRQRSYVVDDWRGHNLPPPPHGYHWVQTGADYVLVAIATGIILQLLLNQ